MQFKEVNNKEHQQYPRSEVSFLALVQLCSVSLMWRTFGSACSFCQPAWPTAVIILLLFAFYVFYVCFLCHGLP